MSHPEHFDLVVYGGTPGGIACAVRAAREGLSVGLVNVTRHLGGMLASGLGLFDALFSGQRCPIAREVFEGFLRHYETKYGRDSENYRLCALHQAAEAHVAEAVLAALVRAEPLEPTWMHVAESAAWALVLARRKGIAPAAIDVAELQRVLVQHGVMLAFFNDVDMASPEPWVPAVQFFGCRGFFSSYDARATEPLDSGTAELWVDAAADELAGTLRPVDVAAALAKTTSGRPVNRAAFSRLLAARGWEESHDAASEPPDQILTRGEACALLFRQVAGEMRSPRAGAETLVR